MRTDDGLDETGAAYERMLGSLFGAQRLGVRFELERVRAATRALGGVEGRVGPILLIGGTNGKGSTAAMIDSCLSAAGHRPGLYTSPHLTRFTERFKVAGREATPEQLVGYHAQIWRDVPGVEELTFFEIATLMALLHFAEVGTDVAVLEVGMGGRLDATNATEPCASIVTGVALDHEDMLGSGIEAIAREKAGIFRAGRPAVIGRCGLEAGREVLFAEARRVGAHPIIKCGEAGVDGPSPLSMSGLKGAHQRLNAECASAALDALELATGLEVPRDERNDGIDRARWPGRMELLPGAPPVLLDAAHNPHAAEALAAALKDLDHARLHLVFGVSDGKDVEGVSRPLVRLSQRVVVSRAPGPRALPPERLAPIARAALEGAPVPVMVEPDVARALDLARRDLEENDLVVVCGSIFLVGAARALLLGEPADPLTVTDPSSQQTRP